MPPQVVRVSFLHGHTIPLDLRSFLCSALATTHNNHAIPLDLQGFRTFHFDTATQSHAIGEVFAQQFVLCDVTTWKEMLNYRNEVVHAEKKRKCNCTEKASAVVKNPDTQFRPLGLPT